MKHSANLALLTALGLALPGCIVTKDMDEETESAAATESSSTTSAATDTVTASGTATTGAESTGSDSGASVTGSTGSDAGGDTMSRDTEDTESTTGDRLDVGGTTGSGGETDGGDDQQLCEETDGQWDTGACGHYQCGLPNECEAVVPGCNCGPNANFTEGVGCVADDMCDVQQFACGDELQCALNVEYCYVIFSGVKGSASYECGGIPVACSGDLSCECLESEQIVGIAEECSVGDDGSLLVETFAP